MSSIPATSSSIDSQIKAVQRQTPPLGKPYRVSVARLRLVLFFGLGALAGYFWLSPVFVPPGSLPLTEGGLSVERIMRVFGVLLVFPLVAGSALHLPLRERVLRLALWTFACAPALSLLLNPNVNFLVGTIGPFLAGGLALVCLSALKPDEFASWVAGVGLVATVFLMLGLRQYGLETSGFYGRPRSHMGFIHPTQTATAIFVAGLFSLQVARRFLRRSRLLRRLMLAGIAISAGTLLLAADSRSTMLVSLLVALCAGFAQVVKRPAIRLALVSLLLIMPIIGYAVAMWGDTQSDLWIALESFSSERLITYRESASRLAEASLLTALIGPPLQSAGGGFASAESAYMSVFLDFGFLTLISLFVFLLVLGWQLSRAHASLAYGCLCAVTIFFAIDAQGVTPSNLAVFLLLAYAVRCALSSSSTVKQPRSMAPVVA